MDIAADFDDIAIHLDDLVGGGNFGETINNILNLLGPMIWDLVKGYLFPLLDDILLKVLNDALAGCNIADLVQNGSCFQERLADILKNHSEMPFPLFKSGVYHWWWNVVKNKKQLLNQVFKLRKIALIPYDLETPHPVIAVEITFCPFQLDKSK